MEKTEVFKKELSYIKNHKFLNDIKVIISLLPDYFFEVPASSTGKYHPSFSLGDGGLVRHTKVAVRIAVELLNNNSVIETNGNKYVPLLTIKPYHLAGPLVIASAMSGLFLSTARTIKVTAIKITAIPFPISALNFFM